MIASELIARVTVMGASKAIRDLTDVGAASDSTGAKLGKGLMIGALVGVAALAAVGVASIKMAGDLQQGVNRLKTGGGDIQDSFQSLWNGIQKVAVATGVLTGPLTNAMYLIVSSGQRGAQAMSTLTAAAQGAQIEMANVKDVTQILTTIQTNWGVSTHTAAQYMDGLVSAVSHGKITLENLSVAMSPILPMAHELGIHFSDIAAAMSDMTNQGVDANRGAQALRFVMQSIIAPTAGAQKAMKEFGVNSETVAQTLKTSFPDALQIYITAAEKGGGTTKDFVDRLGLMVGGGTRAGQALWALAQSMGVWRTDIAAVNTALGDTSKNVMGWATVQGNLNLQIDRGKAALEVLLQNLGAKLIPVVTTTIGRLADFASGLSDAMSSPGVSKMAGQWLTVAQNIGRANDAFGTFLAKMKDIASAKAPGQTTSAVEDFFTTLGFLSSKAVLGVDVLFTSFNYLLDTAAHKTITLKEALYSMGTYGSDAVLSVANANKLLAQGFTTVKDDTTGATINLREYVKSGGLATSTTISMNNALALLKDKAGHILTAADAARLLALGIKSVDDPAHRASIALALIATNGVIVKNGVVSMSDAFKILGITAKDHILNATDAQRLLALGVKDVNDKLRGTIDLQKALDRTKAELKINDQKARDAANDVNRLRDKLLALHRTITTPPINTTNIVPKTTDAVNQARLALLGLRGPYKPIVDVGSVVAAGATADTVRNKLRALNGTSSWTAYANINQINTVTNVVNTISSGPGNARASGGMIDEPVIGIGQRTGQRWTFGENGPEMVTPMKGGGGSGGSSGGGGDNQPVHIHVHVAGREVTTAILPDLVSAIRTATGVRM
jgi:TP901 family phage tail tape measure protein